MADKRILYTERMTGAGHPALPDTLNRLTLVEHNTDGTHKTDKVVTSVNTRQGAVTLGASDVGLGNCDNTSDANKPVSTATGIAIGAVQSDLNSHTSNTSNPHSVTYSQVGAEQAGTVATHAALTAAHGATEAVVGTTNVQTLTNKTINSSTIGSTTPSTGAFTDLSFTGTFTGGTGVIDIGSGQIYKTATGNLLIGTTTDDGINKLQVNGSGYFSDGVKIGTNSTAAAGHIFNNAAWGMGFVAASSSTNIAGWFDSSVNTKMALTSSGNLLIGTTTDDGVNKLQVNGNITARGFNTYPLPTIHSNPNTGWWKLGSFINSAYTSGGVAKVIIKTGNGYNIDRGQRVFGEMQLRWGYPGGVEVSSEFSEGNIQLGYTFNAETVDIYINYNGISYANAESYSVQMWGQQYIVYNHALVNAGSPATVLTSARVISTANNTLIGTTTDDGVNKLQVNGSIKISDLTGSSSSFYQSGSCTLYITDSVGNSATMGSYNAFMYSRIGNTVTVSGTLYWISTSALVDNSRIRIQGLPFPTKNVGNYRIPVTTSSNSPGTYNVERRYINFGADASQTFIWGGFTDAYGTDSELYKAHLGNAGTIYGFSITYLTD